MGKEKLAILYVLSVLFFVVSSVGVLNVFGIIDLE